jgi:uncharacterized membrane protein
MKYSLIVTSALAAALAAPAHAESNTSNSQFIDEKCYGVSINEISVCGTDAQSCAYLTGSHPQMAANGGTNTAPAYVENGQPWAYVPKGTCVKIYGGKLTPKTSS